MTGDDFNFSGRDWRDLSPQQWTEARREIFCRAHRLRSQAILALADRLATFVVRGVAQALRFLHERREQLQTAQTDREAIARLQSLDDHALSDLGIRRSEIESVVHSHGCDTTRRRGNCSLAA